MVTGSKKKKKKKNIGDGRCLCGSGKKYKNCCLQKEIKKKELKDPKRVQEWILEDLTKWEEDEEAWLVNQSFNEEAWEKFEESSFTEKIRLFRNELRNENSEYDLSDMLETICFDAWEQNEHHQLKDILDFFAAEYPREYDKGATFYILCRLQVLIALNEIEEISTVIKSSPNYVDDDLYFFFSIFNLLCYYEQSQELIDVMEENYNAVVDYSDYIPGVEIEYFSCLISLKIFILLDKRNQVSQSDIQKLIDELESLNKDFNSEELEIMVERLIGNEKTSWKAEAFDPQKTKAKDRRKNLYLLSLDFLRYLKDECQVPFSKGELARGVILEYWCTQKRRQKRKKEASILYPRPSELDRFLASLINLLSPQPICLACTIELFPFLIDFLVDQGLIFESDKDGIMSDIESIKKDCVSYLRKVPLGDVLVTNINRNWKAY